MSDFVDRGVKIFFETVWCASVNIQNLKDETDDYYVLYEEALGLIANPVAIEGPDQSVVATANTPLPILLGYSLPVDPADSLLPVFLDFDIDFTRNPPSEEDKRIVAYRLAWIREALTQPDQDQMLWALSHPSPKVREYTLAHVAEWRSR